jgi:D-erythronate 2-dehydrogenase
MKTADHRRRRLRWRAPGPHAAGARHAGRPPIERIVLADQVPPPADLLADPRVEARTGKLLTQCEALRDEAFDGIFHLASAVSGECEADFDLGLRPTSTARARCSTPCVTAPSRAGRRRGWSSSSIAVFGPDPAYPLPPLVADATLPTPQTSYGVQKLICEHLVADYTRKGYIDGRAARLMTVTVRPGRPNGAASSFFSGIIREPLAGEEAILPVSAEVSHPVATVHSTVDGLIAVYEASREAFVGRSAMNAAGLNVTVQQMLDALEAVAGPEVRARVRFQRDDRIAGIVANWPKGVTTPRANALGLLPRPVSRTSSASTSPTTPANPAALKGMQ